IVKYLDFFSNTLLVMFKSSFAGLSIWPSFHFALSNGSVFVDFSAKSDNNTISNVSLSLVNMETNTSLLSRTLPSYQLVGREEFNCSCFPYAGTFRFLLRQTSIAAVSPHANGTHVRSSASWWSSELLVQWPTFHISVERAGNRSEYFQVGLSTNEHFKACSSGTDSALFLEVNYIEYNQIGRNTIEKVRAQIRKPIRPLRSQSVALPCAFPFTERDFISVVLRSPHTVQEVKSSGPLYLSRIFPYKLLVENVNAYKRGCVGTVTVKMITPPCTHVNGKILATGSGPEEPSPSPLAFNWLTPGENETDFNCSVFHPGRNKYCFRFVFNFSQSPMLPSPSPSLSSVPVGSSPLGGNMIVVLGISFCLAVIMATVVVTVWRKLCQTPQCSSVHRGSIHSPGGRKLSDEASICGHSLQRPSLSDGHCPSAAVVSQTDAPSLGAQPLSPQALVIPLSYRLAQQQLKEMKKQGLKEATQLYHVSSSPVHDTALQTCASPDTSPVPSPTGFACPAPPVGTQDNANHSHLSRSTSGVTSDRLSPRVELVLGPPASGRSSKWRDRTADWVEMVERSKMSGLRRGGGDTALGNSYRENPNFRRTSSFSDTKLLSTSSAPSMQFRERSMTQVGSRTLPEGSSWTKGRRERQPHPSYPIPDGTGERKRLANPGDRGEELVSGIGGPSLTVPRSHEGNRLAKGRQRSSSFNVSSSDRRKDWCHSLPMSGDQGSGCGSPYRLSEAEQRMLDLDLGHYPENNERQIIISTMCVESKIPLVAT
uniref:Thrombospondin, type I, domain containing 1 n=1 Tax=Fundulus heteroclitus TaxID=8078 RepID=A0A3Q2PU47_FUNHE